MTLNGIEFEPKVCSLQEYGKSDPQMKKYTHNSKLIWSLKSK